MKFKEDAVIETDGFWYDLFEGGYIEPEELLECEEDIGKVIEAMNILIEFYNSAQEQEVIEDY